MITATNPVFQFIEAASRVTGFDFNRIVCPRPIHKANGGKRNYSVCCRLRWLASIYAEERGMSKRAIIELTGWNCNVPYNAQKELRMMKDDKPLCRILRDVMGEITKAKA